MYYKAHNENRDQVINLTVVYIWSTSFVPAQVPVCVPLAQVSVDTSRSFRSSNFWTMWAPAEHYFLSMLMPLKYTFSDESVEPST